MIEANDASDERQYTYSLKRLESSERRDTQRMSFLGKVVWVLGLVSTIVLFFTMYMLFYGGGNQSLLAQDLLTHIFAAVGGGLIVVIQQVVQWLLRRK